MNNVRAVDRLFLVVNAEGQPMHILSTVQRTMNNVRAVQNIYILRWFVQPRQSSAECSNF